MSKQCEGDVEGKKNHRMGNALVVTAFIVLLCGILFQDHLSKAIIANAGEIDGTESVEATEEAEMTAVESTSEVTDLEDAFSIILQGATREYIAGYAVDEAFLMWVSSNYGREAILQLACGVIDGEMSVTDWDEVTGESIHVLWLRYCQDNGFMSYQLENVQWLDCKSEEEAVFSFTGDFNFAEDWDTTKYMDEQENGIYDCFSDDLLQLMNESDLMVVNNEFVYSDGGTPVAGKAYTFKADLKRAELLHVFGTDLANLANNHAYDYGDEGLCDTFEALNEENIQYMGAGRDIAEASKIMYYVANGKKIAIVSATEIERYSNYTKEATADSNGVLKTLDPTLFLEVIKEAEVNSDYVIAMVHWGTEGNLFADASQKNLARQFVEAGADAIIGGHPHRLQGAAFIGDVPVAFSLGNFWFTDATLYTSVAQIVISNNGDLQLKYVPCLQKDLTTSLITDTNEKGEFYNYLAAISYDLGIGEDGTIYHRNTEEFDSSVIYDSNTCITAVTGGQDNEGYTIDVVGIRK